ncbi:TKL protein kinase [Saprolegnia diclina VS20]|uniref:TKL protein kinase n=1 Tax=Saprolegnia diclina (strain VS20) TaxID=1156394 RepID=T0RDI1_SAPDV|nr:TKL protein kinase [Saprolegnia diclina VS20]EQC27652.1 TKL protein kinase [Saprolegnia diclina VS20]|eukprot:XP_008618920.1 TKL protein kinase [Saprolegnia diclina VS20]
MSACPYAAFGAFRYFVADSTCKSDTCIVDAACTTWSSQVGRMTRFDLPAGTRIGNLTNFASTTLTLNGSDRAVGDLFTRALLPPTLRSLTFESMRLSPLRTLPLPPGVLHLTIHDCALVAVDTLDKLQWPPLLASLTLRQTNVLDLPDLTTLPPSVTELYIAEDKVTTLQDYDWSHLEAITLESTARPIRLTNVTFSSRLQTFDFDNVNIVNMTIDNATFHALVALSPRSVSDKRGYRIGSIQTSADDCTLQGGQPRTLWSPTNSVCVLVPAPTLAPSEQLPPQLSRVGMGLGIAAGVLAVGLIIALTIYRRLRKKRALDHGSTMASSVLAEELRHLDLYKLDPLLLHTTSKTPLAAGAFGEVWRGTYNEGPVAIKRNKNKDPVSVQHFIAEISLMAKMESPYIVKLVGASWTRPIDIEAVVEYMDLGDLRTYLATHMATQFPWSDKALCVQSIVFGLVYLHTFDPPIIHRDLKSKNILLDAVKGTKFTDFGISREIDESSMTNGIGTYQWMAPEVISGTRYSAAADVYSFGVVLAELSTHQVPYSDAVHPETGRALTQQSILSKVTTGELQPTFDATTPMYVKD